MTDARSLDDVQQAVHRHWWRVALSTTPIDKVRARAAIEAVYRVATGRPPACILLFDSPLDAEVAGTFFSRNYPEQQLPWDRRTPPLMPIISASIAAAGGGAARSRLADEYERVLEGPVRAALDAAYYAGPDRTLLKRAFDAVRRQLPPIVRNSLIAPWARHKGWRRRARLAPDRSLGLRDWFALAAYHSFRRAAFPHLSVTGNEALISAVMEVCEACGWCWLYPEIAIVADRPSLIELDGAGRLHAEHGPALAYRDGFSLHALHGVRVERRVIERPDWITVADVEREPNAEIRRLLVERMGYRRYLSLSRADAVSRDETGILWHRELPSLADRERRAWSFVEVVNGTAEPDGSRRHYFLRVPPTMRSARDAVAWSYGLGRSDYQPLIRT